MKNITRKSVRLWWHDNGGISNFGDELNPFLVEKISGTQIKKIYKIPRFSYRRVNLVIGSIIHVANRYCNVWGSGIIRKKTIVKGGNFFAVRGPYTRYRVLQSGHKCPEVFGDPALLLPRYYVRKKTADYDIGITPHIVDFDLIKDRIKDERILVIDLKKPVTKVIDAILSCRVILSSSLHGLIVAHSYGIPAIWITVSNKLYGDNIKFYDYFTSVGILEYKPYKLKSNKRIVYEDLEKIVNEGIKDSMIYYDLETIQNDLLNTCPFS